MGSNEKQQGLRQDLSISWLKEFWRFPVATWRHMSGDPSRSGQNTSGSDSLYLDWSGSCRSIKRKILAQDVAHAALTGSGCHLRIVKIISRIGLNEKPMDFKGEREVIFARHTHENVRPANIKERKFPPRR